MPFLRLPLASLPWRSSPRSVAGASLVVLALFACQSESKSPRSRHRGDSGDTGDSGQAGEPGQAGTGSGKGGDAAGAGASTGGRGGGAAGGRGATSGDSGEGGVREGDGASGGDEHGGDGGSVTGSGNAGVSGSGTSGGGNGGASGSAGDGAGSAGDDGSGCTGGLEEVKSGLCVATMATLPSDDGDYRIDRTEVTRGQYEAWLATNPSPLPVVITACALNDSYEPYVPCALAEGVNADQHPMACIDWCDARAYCAAVGKRLCGSTLGGAAPYDPSITDWHRDQWGLACNSNGVGIFTYGEPYDATACNSASSGTLPVASLARCQSSVAEYAGVYDLNGNVREWLDQCDPSLSANTCYARGGGFDDGSVGCESRSMGPYRLTVAPNTGFRCCDDL